jgi:rhomboid protease GluP
MTLSSLGLGTRIRSAPASAALLAGLVLAYAVSASLAGSPWEIPADDLLRQGGSFAPALAAGEWWRVLSAAFLHGGLLHLGINLLILADIAALIERHFGWPRGAAVLVVVFLIAAGAGFAASAWWNPESVSIGASGGILGLYGYWLLRLWRGAGGPSSGQRMRRRRIALVSAYLLAAVAAGFLVPGVDNAAHVGGLVAGAVLGTLAYRPSGAPGLAACLAVAAGVVAALAAIPAERADAYRQQLRFAEIYRQFVAEERLANERLGSLVTAGRRGLADDASLLQALEREIIPAFERNVSRWQALAIERDAALAADQGNWQRYSRLRLESAQALREAIVAVDDAVRQRAIARFEAASEAARQIAEAAHDGQID